MRRRLTGERRVFSVLSGASDGLYVDVRRARLAGCTPPAGSYLAGQVEAESGLISHVRDALLGSTTAPLFGGK